MKKGLLRGTLALTVAAFMLTGCGGSNATESAQTSEYAGDATYTTELYAEESMEMANETSDTTQAAQLDENESISKNTQKNNRKLITTMNINAETHDLNTLLTNIENKTEELGGYIESTDINMGTNSYDYYYMREGDYYVTNSASVTIRIPEDKLDSFVSNFEEQSNITYKSSSVEDVTLKYSDVKTRISALETEEERLLDFMEKATSIEEMMTVEDRLTEVQYELQSYESQLRTMDNLINYSTVNINIDEVKEYTEVKEEVRDGFFERIADGFMENSKSVLSGLKEFVIWFISHIPQFIVLGIFVGIIVLIVKKSNKKNKRMMNYYETPNGGRRDGNANGPSGNSQQGGV